MNRKNLGNLLIMITAILWSFIGVIEKSMHTDVFVIAGITSLCALVVVRFFSFHKKLHLNLVTFFAGFATAGMNLSFFLANKYTTVTNTIVLQYTSPIFVLLIKIIFEKYYPKKREIFALFLCTSGMLIFFANQLSSGNMLGNMLALLSGILFSIDFILNSKPECDSFSSMILMHSICFIFAFTYSLISKSYPVVSEIHLLMFLGIVIIGISSVLYSIAIHMTSALNANIIALSEVFLTSIWSHFIYHDVLSTVSLIGLLIMTFAIILVSISADSSSDQIPLRQSS